MTIYYTLTFMLLAAEMVTFCILVFPLPYTVRKHLFRFFSESPIVAKIAYGLKISFIFVGVLFADALQRMFRVTAEQDSARTDHTVHDVRTESSFAARKFYAQRNMYLTGFCLFLSLVLTRTFSIVLDLIQTQEDYAKLKKAASVPFVFTATTSKNNIASNDQAKQIEELKKKLAESAAKNRDLDIVRKQAAQNAEEYDRLATKYNEATGQTSNKKSD
ncbi:B-cell receptor-associated protein 31-like-domain-containing protein [Boletus edulis BED1]|uniref:Endoplasmic reticulum transmembrane protein n=1 Tax=Boletus edulis BED1 TaxID=1328754 RepID=A0AAD4BU15_BOLED|nr:B-cell receptor-associated protein 31-like-domain-containing protein [Boletus edulis BED1]